MMTCCATMSENLWHDDYCVTHDDPYDCDVVMLCDERGVGIVVRDGGSSFISIQYCPWCGTDLNRSTRREHY